ncbi:T9SS type A sorting domain-containing protein [bacterium]|nr:T9SS type A sorting domain-containing protein [bacterium]
MRVRLATWLCAFGVLLSLHSLLHASPWVVGYSGAPGTQSCASSCHGGGSGTVVLQGFPESYFPDSTYLIQLTSSGQSIKNFNASCRVGTGSLMAGILMGSGNTVTYSVPAELNGVHLSVLDQATAQFFWIAPPEGSGEVRLYVAAHQGNEDGPNTSLVLVATENESSSAGEWMPSAFELSPPYPNPFNSNTQLTLTLTRESNTVVRIFDVTGREVSTLLSERLGAGQHRLEWNAAHATAGLYFMTVESGDFRQTQKLVYLP